MGRWSGSGLQQRVHDEVHVMLAAQACSCRKLPLSRSCSLASCQGLKQKLLESAPAGPGMMIFKPSFMLSMESEIIPQDTSFIHDADAGQGIFRMRAVE
jgi:hypothetical protein